MDTERESRRSIANILTEIREDIEIMKQQASIILRNEEVELIGV